jgi:hypothetical protein
MQVPSSALLIFSIHFFRLSSAVGTLCILTFFFVRREHSKAQQPGIAAILLDQYQQNTKIAKASQLVLDAKWRPYVT